MAVNFKLFCILFSFITICQAQISFRKDSGAVFLRYNGQDVINLSAADKEVLVQGERFRYFGNFIIVRRVNGAFKRIINQLNSLGLSFDGTTVQVVTRTQPDIFGPGALYIHQSAGVTFYTSNSNLIQRISDALSNPGSLPTPPPEEGDWSSWGSWSSCSATCGSGFRTRRRQCEGCQEDCCVCPPGATFQIEECLQLSCKGQWSGWSGWSSCSLSCGGGFRTRMRQCVGQGECFPGKSFQHQQCNSQNCCT